MTEYPVQVITTKEIWVRAAEVVPARVEALIAAGRTCDATELARAFARGLHGRSAPAPQAAITVCHALLHEARGQRQRAATRRDLASLSAAGDADRVASTLRGHGVPAPRRGGRGYGDELSPRELEVVRLAITGRAFTCVSSF